MQADYNRACCLSCLHRPIEESQAGIVLRQVRGVRLQMELWGQKLRKQSEPWEGTQRADTFHFSLPSEPPTMTADLPHPNIRNSFGINCCQ